MFDCSDIMKLSTDGAGQNRNRSVYDPIDRAAQIDSRHQCDNQKSKKKQCQAKCANIVYSFPYPPLLIHIYTKIRSYQEKESWIEINNRCGNYISCKWLLAASIPTVDPPTIAISWLVQIMSHEKNASSNLLSGQRHDPQPPPKNQNHGHHRRHAKASKSKTFFGRTTIRSPQIRDIHKSIQQNFLIILIQKTIPT